MSFLFPNFDPIAIYLPMGLKITWYSMAYLFGCMFSYLYIKYTDFEKIFQKDDIENIIFYSILGIILGGRIGYILFYNFNFYINYPSEIFKLWNGGMSFHGGLLGVIFALSYWGYSKRSINKFFYLSDRVSASAPVGIFFGRIANFINGELFGRETNSYISVIILENGQFVQKHPSQLYEALFEGIILFIIMTIILFKKKKYKTNGITTGCFLILYGIFRIALENFRTPDQEIGFIFNYFTMGQILSIPMIILGIYIIYKRRNHVA